MTTPYGGIQYDKDGLPVTSATDPFGQPQQMGYATQAQQPTMPQPMVAPMMQPQLNQQVVGPPKSMIVAAVLCFFLGEFGAHNFYLGYTNKGIAQLLLAGFSAITAFFFIGGVTFAGLLVWVVIEWIMILSGSGSYKFDAYGRLLQR